MPSSSNRREFLSVKVNKSLSLNLSLIVCAAIFCLIAAMLVLTRVGSADGGIGQPVILGPPQNLPAGSGPNSISFYFNDSGNPALAVTNSGSDTVSVIQQAQFGESFGPESNLRFSPREIMSFT